MRTTLPKERSGGRGKEITSDKGGAPVSGVGEEEEEEEEGSFILVCLPALID